MSHVVTIETKVKDSAAIAAACQRLELAAPVHGTAELFSGSATGTIVQLPGWQYPVVIDTARNGASGLRHRHEGTRDADKSFRNNLANRGLLDLRPPMSAKAVDGWILVGDVQRGL